MQANVIEKRKKTFYKKLLVRLLYLAIVLSITAVICLHLFFNIESVTVAGASKYDPAEIIKCADIPMGSNLFFLDKKEVASKIYEQFPYIETVDVTLLMPDTVEIEILETEEKFVSVFPDEKFAIIGENDRLLKVGSGCYGGRLPLIFGFDVEDFPEGALLNSTAVDNYMKANSKNKGTDDYKKELSAITKAAKKLDTIKNVLYCKEEANIDYITYIDVETPAVKILYKNRTMIDCGTEFELLYKLKFVKTVIFELGNTFSGVIELGTLPQNKRVYTRECDIKPQMNEIYLKNYY